MTGTIDERLQEVQKIYFDSMVLVYFIEESPAYINIVDRIFDQINDGQIQACTSYLTLLEVLVKPFKAGNTVLASQYREILTQGRNLEVVPVGKEVAEKAAEIRAQHRSEHIRTADSIHLATAVCQNVSLFLTNDLRLKRHKNIVDILALDEALETQDK